MSRLGCIRVACLFLPICAIAAIADGQQSKDKAKPLPDDVESRVHALVNQLDSDRYAKRELATRELKNLGREIIPQIERALAKSESPEVRLRLEQVLDFYRVRLEVYTTRKDFEKRLNTRVREVTFDDVDTSKEDVVAFSADRYAKELGIVITGQEGQFAGRTFGFPMDYIPVSAPNSYAPGPKARKDAAARAGGSKTDVTFVAGKRQAVVTAFAVTFIDADYPTIAETSLSAFDQKGVALGEPIKIEGANASQVFCGVIAVDGSGRILPTIARLHIKNGGCWPGVEAGEGVTLDDFLFTVPVAE